MRKCILLLAVLLFARPAAGSDRYVPGDVLVVLRGEEGVRVSSASLRMGREAFRTASIATASGAWVKDTYAELSETANTVFALLHSDLRSTDQLIEELQARPEVLAVSPNYWVQTAKFPDDPVSPLNQLWGLQRINAPAAWERTRGSREVRVAVIDTGIDYTHPDLRDNVDHELSRSFYGSDPTAYMDDNGHGTHVAGIIGAMGNNGRGLVGVDWEVGLVALKALGADGRGFVSGVLRALDYLTGWLNADPDLNVAAVNLSLTVYSGRAPGAQAGDPLWRALRTLDSLNRAVITVAAGNNGVRLGAPAPETVSEDQGILPGQYVYPASYTGLNTMISVSALSQDLTLAPFSNWNAALAAPGVGIVSAFPQSLSEDRGGKFSPHTLADGTRLGTAGGTSMAAPYVAGAAALLRAAEPDRTAYQIRTALVKGQATGPSEGILDIKRALDYQEEFPIPASPEQEAESVPDSVPLQEKPVLPGVFAEGATGTASLGRSSSGCDVLRGTPALLLSAMLALSRGKTVMEGEFKI